MMEIRGDSNMSMYKVMKVVIVDFRFCSSNTKTIQEDFKAQ